MYYSLFPLTLSIENPRFLRYSLEQATTILPCTRPRQSFETDMSLNNICCRCDKKTNRTNATVERQAKGFAYIKRITCTC